MGDLVYFFTYGTLRRGEPAHGFLSTLSARFIGPATINAELVDLGAFPGLLPPTTVGSYVKGEVFLIDRRDLPILDRYESVDVFDHASERGLYRRITAWVKIAGAVDAVKAEVYFFNNRDHELTGRSGEYPSTPAAEFSVIIEGDYGY